MINEKEQFTETGGFAVETDHIFPVIKKWLYSEKEIFLREIVSNACDACTKVRRLLSLGEIKDIADDFKITVKLDKEEKTITVSDNGIGMTKEEIKRYICQIALSGALEFISKYEKQDKGDANNGIIGHFGLGFYSSFMVSSTVDVITKSYSDAPAVKLICEENGEYTLTASEKETRGTDIVMHINEEGEEYLNAYKLREVLEKYCSFMPIDIYFEDGEEKEEKEEKETKDPVTPLPINDPHPLWTKQPSECTEEEYKNFYKKVFHEYRDPLFWIHINADYPLNFKGIIYFPKLNHEYDSLEGQIKLYYNQVFVEDNIKEVIPEFMLMLKGVLDCPDLPLNVSRSYLQNNGYVSKISAHIVKKIADKLCSLFNTDRENYEKLWDDIKLFTEYGCLRDQKFYDRVKTAVLFKTTEDTYLTVDEYLEKAQETNKEKIYYASDKIAQNRYVELFQNQGITVVMLDKIIDTQYIHTVENDKKVQFLRIDSDVADVLKNDDQVTESKELETLFRDIAQNKDLKVSFENLKDTNTTILLNLSEQTRRFDDMMRMYSPDHKKDASQLSSDTTLIVNMNSPIIQQLEKTITSSPEKATFIAGQMYLMALMSLRPLTPEENGTFNNNINTLLNRYMEKE